MGLTPDQELRKELLLFSLSKQPDLEAAIEMAAAMEQYVLCGLPLRGGEGRAAPASSRKNGRGEAAASTEATDEEGAPAAGPRAAGVAPNKKRRWSVADDCRLEQLWRSDRTLEEIASELDRTVPSLYSRGRALGLSKRDHVAHSLEAQKNGSGKPYKRATSSGHHDADGNRTVQQSSASCKPSGQKGSTAKATWKSGAEHVIPRNKMPKSADALLSNASPPEESQIFVDSIVHFLRSRDYSVVRVAEGRFRLDGRRVVTVDELLDKANQLRKSLGQPPFELSYNQ